MCGKAMEKDKRVEQSRDMKMGEETRLETSREKEARVTNKIEHSKNNDKVLTRESERYGTDPRQHMNSGSSNMSREEANGEPALLRHMTSS